jgi:uncharacterized protein YbgA (DUF1722 family)
MLIHGQNSYAQCGKQCASRREAQSHELVNKYKNSLYFLVLVKAQYKHYINSMQSANSIHEV